MHFDDLNEAEKISYIQEVFLCLIEDIADGKKKLSEYIKENDPAFGKTNSIIKNLEKLEGCVCGGCINSSVITSPIPGEFDVLLDVAREQAKISYETGEL